MRLRSICIASIILVSLTFGYILSAESGSVPIGKQTDLLIKMLGYNKSLAKVDGDAIRIGVIYSQSNAESMTDWQNVAQSLFEMITAGKTIHSKKITFSGIDFTSADGLKNTSSSLNVSVFYITPGHDANLSAISNVAKSEGILTFSGVRSYLTQGIASGVELVGNSPKIVINLPSAKSQGAEFNAQLLSIANVIK